MWTPAAARQPVRRWLRLSALFGVWALVQHSSLTGNVMGQSSCDEPPGEDVYWVVSGSLTCDNLFCCCDTGVQIAESGFELDWDELWGSQGAGAATWRNSTSKGMTVGGSLVCETTTHVHRFAKHSTWYGSGASISAKAYVKGPPGTKYYAIRRYSGAMSTSKSPTDGSGSVSASFNGQTIPTDAAVSIFGDSPTLEGYSTGPTVTVNGAVYSLARSEPVNISTLVVQGYCVCCGCPPLDTTLDGEVHVTLTLDVGLGHLPCAGTLNAPSVLSDCVEFPSGAGNGAIGVHRDFEVAATFDGDCGCCEYRQYVRTNRTVLSRGFESAVWSWLWGMDDNCDGEPTDGECFVEDTRPSSKPGCSDFCVRQGARAIDAMYPSCRTPGIDVYGNGRREDRLTACSYVGKDSPQIDPIPAGTSYAMLVDFEGRIVVRKECLGTNADKVIARRRWTVECAGAVPPSPNLPLADWPLPYRTSLQIAGRHAIVRLSMQGGVLVGLVSLPIVEGENPRVGDVGILFGGRGEYPLDPPEAPLIVGSPIIDSLQAVRLFAIDASDSLYQPVSLDIAIGGDSRSLLLFVDPVHPSLYGDLDLDGAIATSDLAIILGSYGACPPRQSDINADGAVDGLDIATLLAGWGTAAGDIDGNGLVDGSDLALLLSDWGLPPACPADLSGDGAVDGTDLSIFLGLLNP